MSHRTLLTVLVAIAWFPPLARAQQPAASPPVTAQEIVQRYINARGGLEKLKAIRTLRLRGPVRPNGKPGHEMLRARAFYFTIGDEGNDGSPWESYDEYGLRARSPAFSFRRRSLSMI